MMLSVELDSQLERLLNSIANEYHKKKSDIIKEAIIFYSESIKDKKKERFENAIKKVAHREKVEMEEFEGTYNDGL